MFGFLKKKIKGAIDKITKKVEEEAPEETKEVEVKVEEKPEKKKVEIKEKKKKEEVKKEEDFIEKVEEETKEEIKVEETKPKEEVKITYFVHGTTTDNEEGIASGHKNVGLSELGKQQSIELRDQLKRDFDIIFTSDLKRAVDSAKLTWPNKKIIQDKRLRECNYGNLNGKSKEEFLEFKKYHNPIKDAYPKGECYKDVEKRIKNFLNDLYQEYKGEHIAIVAHRYTQLAIEVLLNGKSWEQAIEEDWRKTKSWKSGWNYVLDHKLIKDENVPEKKGFFKKIKEKVTTKKISNTKFEELFNELEMVMLENNVALEVIDKIKEDLKMDLVDVPINKKEVGNKIQESLKQSVLELFIDGEDLVKKVKAKKEKPLVIVFVGVNGSGKTTTIAKLAKKFLDNQLKPLMVASDTFRAAAIHQLEEHGNRLGVKVIKHDYGSDPAAVAFDGIKYAKSHGLDVVLIDTAGRLHSNVNLVDEMKKIVRVANPDIKLFIGESITGNDCVEQAKKFNQAIGIDGIILSKADVDEKGGAAISVSFVTNEPILYLGNGQDYQNLVLFDKEKVVEGLGL